MNKKWLSCIMLLCNFYCSYSQNEQAISKTKYKYGLDERQDSILKLFSTRFEANLSSENQIFTELERLGDAKLKNSVVDEYVRLFDNSQQERYLRIIPYLSDNHILESSVQHDLSWMRNSVKNRRFIEEILLTFYSSPLIDSCELFKSVNPAELDNFVSRLAYNSRNIVSILKEKFLFSRGCKKENIKMILNEMMKQKLISKIED